MKRKQLTPDEIKDLKQESWRVIVGGILINIIVGSFYSFGSYSIYLASYLKSHDVSVTADSIAFIFPFMNLIMNALIPFGEKFVNKLGTRYSIFFGIYALSICYYLLANIKSSIIWGFIAVFCIAPLYGVMYMLSFFCSWRYFPTSPQNVNAILQTGFGFGGCIFTYFAYEIVNYQNQEAKHVVQENGIDRYYFEECISYNTQTLFNSFSAIIAIFGSLAIILLWKPTSLQYKAQRDENLEHYREQAIKQNSHSMQKSVNEQSQIPLSECISLKQGVYSKSFLFLFIMAITSSLFGFFAMSYYKIYGILFKFDDASLTLIGAISFTIFGCSRAFWSKLILRLGFNKSFYLLQISSVIFTTIFVNLGHVFLCYGVCIVFLIFLQGGVFTWFSTFTPKVFGYRYASLIFGLILFGFAVSNVLMHGITYLTFQQGPKNFDSIYFIIVLLHGVACSIKFIYNENPKWL